MVKKYATVQLIILINEKAHVTSAMVPAENIPASMRVEISPGV
jgi:hypothetical protein